MLRVCACSARSSAVVKLPDEPRPVPAGMSAMRRDLELRASAGPTASAPRG